MKMWQKPSVSVASDAPKVSVKLSTRLVTYPWERIQRLGIFSREFVPGTNTVEYYSVQFLKPGVPNMVPVNTTVPTVPSLVSAKCF